MPNHSVRACDEKDFDKLTIYQTDKIKGKVEVQKEGHKNAVTYKFDGDWAKRPAPVQIVQNYTNAVQKGGGEILFKSEGSLYAKLKKADAVYWIEVYSDGSGDYKVSSVKEEKMKQDVVMTAAEIKNGIRDEGKAVFYGIYFDTDKSTLKPESAPTLTEIAKFLKENAAINVYIVGHTDNTGSFDHNLQLSKSRAEAVISELAGKYGVSKNQLAAQGVASLAPVASNDKEEGKAKNRRVEIVKR
jgi:outer membrane protein OmpA-like peptidoglycan-associated protein